MGAHVIAVPSSDLYPTIKALHVGLALGSGGLFALRGAVSLSGATPVLLAPARTLSYLIDTALLGAAIALLFILRLDPLVTPWVLAKLALLVVYIVLGSLALKRARTQAGRAVSFLGAMACFAAIYAVARSHDPLAFLVWLPRP